MTQITSLDVYPNALTAAGRRARSHQSAHGCGAPRRTLARDL